MSGFYDSAAAPYMFDAVIATVFAPFGGITRLRNAALDRLAPRTGETILELGCGSGGVTQLLARRGADILAVDGSAAMLVRARRRAPTARFAQGLLQNLDLNETFDAAMLAFVLHELTAAQRASALAAIARVLRPGGRIGILDHAVPKSGAFASAWRAFLMKLEPPTVGDCIRHGYRAELEAAGFTVTEEKALAAGTAAFWLATR